LEQENGELPETWRAITGRGGYHIYYRSDEKIKNTTNLYPGIDIRGEGGYVVAPPSIHQNGNYYQWEYDPEDTDLHFADQQVMKFIKGSNNESHKEKFKLPDKIKSGERNDTLFRYGCSLQAKGYSDEEILNKLEDANTRCDVPLKDEELTTIYNSVIEKEKVSEESILRQICRMDGTIPKLISQRMGRCSKPSTTLRKLLSMISIYSIKSG
jgi:Primase C terminal 1 (PriCT-1)./Bifunctional DNA primase/polymerase, N-terminal.